MWPCVQWTAGDELADIGSVETLVSRSVPHARTLKCSYCQQSQNVSPKAAVLPGYVWFTPRYSVNHGENAPAKKGFGRGSQRLPGLLFASPKHSTDASCNVAGPRVQVLELAATECSVLDSRMSTSWDIAERHVCCECSLVRQGRRG